MQNVTTGLFSQPTNQRQQIKNYYQDIAGNAELIQEAIIQTEFSLESAKEGGCIRKPHSIMGPNPQLARRYELQKEVLTEMLAEAKAQTASKKPGV